MWYLIIPPIIVVSSLSFALWYLSRKSADPLVAARASRLGAETQEKVSFVRTRTFFLHLLEKMAYRFKVSSLRMHNSLHTLTQSLKESQRRFQMKIPPRVVLSDQPISFERKNAAEEKKEGKNEGAVRRFLGRERGGVSKSSPHSFPDTEEEKPVFRASVSSARLETSSVVPRPMVGEAVIRPEKTRKRLSSDRLREEDLIARIATNPKDFVAYEGLGDYYLENGNIKDAKECYRQVLKLSPVQRMVKIKIRRLEKLLSQKGE